MDVEVEMIFSCQKSKFEAMEGRSFVYEKEKHHQVLHCCQSNTQHNPNINPILSTVSRKDNLPRRSIDDQ